MKKIVSLLIAIMMLAGMMAVPTMATDEVSVYLFGEKLEFDVPPQIVNGRTLVPMRKIFESLGAVVGWDAGTKTVTSVREDKTIKLTINQNTMYVNGEAVELDVAPCIVDSRTLVPARAVSEAFDLKVDWVPTTKSVLITSPTNVNSDLDSKIVAKIGDYEITQADYNCNYYVIYMPYSQYSQYFGESWMNMDVGDGTTIGEMIKTDTKYQIESMISAVSVAKNLYGITGEDVKDIVKMQMTEIRGSYDSQTEYESFFTDTRMSEKAIEKYFEMYAIFGLLAEKFAEDSNYITEAEVEEVFKEEYADKVKVQHILITTESLDGITPPKTDAEAMAIVNEILTKLGNGEDFGKLIDLYNEDPGMTSSDFYTFGDGEMVKEFETASKNLAVGAYTNPAVKSAYGYHIIKRYPLDFESEEYDMCKTYLAQEKLLVLLEEEMKKISVTWDDAQINSYIDAWHK